MRAALWLRLQESRRRGGLLVLAGGAAVIAAVALWGGDTPDGRYGLATDFAATLSYLAAVFYGAFPLAVDRERKRSYLPGASPVPPWAWALGNAAGASVATALTAAAFFLAAAAGTSLSGGLATYSVTPIRATGTHWLPLAITEVPPDAHAMRFEVRSYLRGEETIGMPDAAMITVNGARREVFPDQSVQVPVAPPRIELRNETPEYLVGIVGESVRVLGGRRSFLRNAARAAPAPALGAAALAAVGAAAGANLTATVAGLLTTVLLMLAGMKGFLVETLEFEGAAQAANEEHDGHHHGPAAPGPAGEAARAVVRAVLVVVPDLAALDATGTVALGEWLDGTRAGRGALLLAEALLVATAAGGLGVRLRRTA